MRYEPAEMHRSLARFQHALAVAQEVREAVGVQDRPFTARSSEQ